MTQEGIMTETEVITYVKATLDFFDETAELACTEIGDGNLNYVFHVVDQASDRSLIVKQAGSVARISDEFIVSPDRNRIETEILRLQGTLAPGYVPEVYHYDGEKNCVVMEDLSDYTILRKALLEQRQFPELAEHLSTFLVETLVSTSDLVLNHKEKKRTRQVFHQPGVMRNNRGSCLHRTVLPAPSKRCFCRHAPLC